MGWTGVIMAREMLDPGLGVGGLERGPCRDTVPDVQAPGMHDELKYNGRCTPMTKPSEQTLTFGNSAGQTALPDRHLGSFLPGKGLGGAGAHRNGQTCRFLPYDSAIRSRSEERCGAGFIDAALSVQDWPLICDELEPHHDFLEKICGSSGQGGDLRGETIPGGNPFEGQRSDP